MALEEFACRGVLLADPARDKTRLLMDLSGRAAADTGLSRTKIRAAVLLRERIGTTAVGNGIALPHASVAGLERPFLLVAKLRCPVDFEAEDGRPVDLVCLLLVPEGSDASKLNALAAVARRLRDALAVAGLRNADTPLDLIDALAPIEIRRFLRGDA